MIRRSGFFGCLHLCLSVFICGYFSSVARAELPHIRLDRVFPLGGRAGSEVVVEISGKDLDDVEALHFDHPGLTAKRIKANQFRVAIGAGVPAGTYDVRAVGKYGISGGRLFAVSHGLTEVREAEPNDAPAKAQVVLMNSAVNGTCDGNGDDFFRFPARKGERVTIDCHAFRLDSTLRASLVLSTAAGKELARSRPYYDRTDPLLDFVAPEGGDYIVGLHDTTFSGGLPYRLVISNRPHIENVFPPAVVPGEKSELTVLGRNLPGGKPDPDHRVLGLPLDRLTVSFTTPRDAAAEQRFTFLGHLPSPCLTARGLQARLPGLSDALNPATLVYAPAPVIREQEPNDTPEKAQAITLPAVVCGCFDRPGDADWYTFTAKAGEQVAVDLLCERLERPGDPFVLILDAKGNEVASLDDHGINFNALGQYNRDPLGVFTAPAKGQYRMLVQERYRHGGPRFLYALHVGKPEPDFYPVVIHETNPDPSCPLVRQGGSAFCELCLNRRHFRGSAVIEAEGLPPGVTCPPVHVSPQTEFATVVFTAAPDAPAWSGAIRLKARATVDGKPLVREVRCAQRRWPIANINTCRICREVCLAVRPGAPYAVQLPAEKLTVAAGGTVEAKATVVRHGDFKGKVQLAGLQLPPGFGFAVTAVPAGMTSAAIKFTVAANVPPGTYTLVLRSDAQVPFNRDPKATSRPNVRVADPSTPLTVVVTAAVKK